MKYIVIIYILLASILYSWDIGSINITNGFKVEIFASNLDSPRGLTSDKEGNIYAGSKSGKVYKIVPSANIVTIIKDLNGPIGVDFHSGDLYVSEIHRIIVFKNISNQSQPYSYKELPLKLPREKWHGWKYIKIGPDNKLYINIGAPCNTCLKGDKRFGTIARVNLDGSNFEIFAKGVRNSVGFDWHPVTKEFWFTDNGPDGFGDNFPKDELNRVNIIGEHFGFPYIHGRSTKDPNFYNSLEIETTPPEFELPAHVAPLGMRFYNGDIIIAEHGSWNRSKKIGYRLSIIKFINGNPTSYNIFADGWLIGEEHYGRPVDLEVLPDNSIIVSDDYNGTLYRFFKP